MLMLSTSDITQQSGVLSFSTPKMYTLKQWCHLNSYLNYKKNNIQQAMQLCTVLAAALPHFIMEGYMSVCVTVTEIT